MPIELRITVIVLCLAFLFAVFHLVAKGRLQMKYSLLWVLLALVMVICAVFPGAVSFFADLFGFQTPANFALMMGVFFLLVIALSLSIIVSWQSNYIRSLVQSQAMLEKKLCEMTASDTDQTEDDETAQ